MKKTLLIALIFLSGSVYAQDCYRSTIQSPSPFLGNHGEIVKLANGTLWEVQHEYEYMYEYYPTVIACPARGILIVRDKRLSARAIKGSGGSKTSEVIESVIENDFTGLKLGNIYRLSNGQLWEQTEAWIWFWYWVRPSVIIYKDGAITKMKVENIDRPVMVRQIR